MRPVRSLRSDRKGVTVVEFAVVAPVMLLMVFGLLDLTFQAYIQATLDGAVNAAARNSTLEANAAGQTALDNQVRTQVQTVVGSATFQFQRSNYASVADIAKPEDYEENGTQPGRQVGECYFDYNRNGRYDLDRGRTGQGGADDFVQYRVIATYHRMFPMAMFGMPADTSLTSTSVLRNQPYTRQTAAGNQRICT